ncbi:MAG: sulfur carrier protein ThiS adenylyltransferase ThiF [Candidatus Aminicenantales bacterium]
MKEFEKGFFRKRDSSVLSALSRSVVGIVGAGGLGSNIAVTLARAGVGKLVIADFDRVEPPDLNRQYYFIDQIGKPKVDALLENLKRINPFSDYEMHNLKVTRENIREIYASVDLLIEALDQAEQKQMIIESWLGHYPRKPIIVASGLAGYGKNNKIHQRKLGNLYICGDEESECDEGISPMAPRVAVVANMQANLAVELLVRFRKKKEGLR